MIQTQERWGVQAQMSGEQDWGGFGVPIHPKGVHWGFSTPTFPLCTPGLHQPLCAQGHYRAAIYSDLLVPLKGYAIGYLVI